MKIIVDVHGGDHPEEVVKGAITALNQEKELTLILAGKEEEIHRMLTGLSYDASRLEILPATEEITCSDEPTVAIRAKKESSLVLAYNRLKDDEEVVGLISAGSTGAVLAGGFMRIGRLKGVSRPALGPVLPTLTGGKVLLMDSGANVDCKPVNLCHFAVMASAYMQAVEGVKNPRVALLCNGTEDEKGNAQVKATFPLLKQMPSINFVGNMEARELLSGDYDVVVADGFAGNVALKSVEGGVKTVTSTLKAGIKSSFMAKIGALFMKGVLKNMKQRLDVNGQGGAVLLGLKKTVVKVYGSCKASAVVGAVSQVKKMAEFDIATAITSGLAEMPALDFAE
ncbi:MAG: phosphate acyltransferase PlsX [Clostridia bacterium]|nr:phosphate acyltransferase PlsX [Clostridia bacterium]